MIAAEQQNRPKQGYGPWTGLDLGGFSNPCSIRCSIYGGIYPKISLLPVLSQINTIDSLLNKRSDFQTCFHDEYALLTRARHTVKVTEMG